MANNGGGNGVDEERMQKVASLAVDLDGAAAAANRTWGGDLSWWTCVKDFW